jgi:predicted nucleotidyltransferase
MRLSPQQIHLIKQTVNRILAAPTEIWLFGSRVDNQQRGGDIDLFIETASILANRAETICQLYANLLIALGDCKIDILLKDQNTPPAAIFEIAKRTGILL